MRYVLDSSVALKWFLGEPDSDKALRLRDDARAAIHELLAPDFFPVEITHALTRAERQGQITPAEGASFVSDLLAELPDLHPSLPLVPRPTSCHPSTGTACTTACTWPWPSGRGASW